MSKLDYSKIFIKDACPTSIGGQAVMEGVMMQGPDRIALAMRLPSGELYLKTTRKAGESRIAKVPVVRGVAAFVKSLTIGMRTLMESADILEQYAPAEYAEEEGRFEKWMTAKFGKKATWNFLMTMSVILALVFTIGVFVVLPTVILNFLGQWMKSAIVLNLIEGVLRIIMFILYVAAIRRVKDIYTVFQYHGAEHKSIHAFENGKALVPAEAREYPTLHPRCGTSFLVFVLIISLLLFSFLGWPNLLLRVLSRILLIPVIAGLSYEILKWAGRSDNVVVRVLSYPGLMLQKLTTAEPTDAQLEVGLLALKAVLVEKGTPMMEGFVDKDGNRIRDFRESDFLDKKVIRNLAGDEAKDDVPGFDYVSKPKAEAEPAQAREASSENRQSAAAATKKGNTLASVLRWGEKQLADIENGRNEAMMILSYATGCSRADVIAHAEAAVGDDDCREYAKRIEQRLSGVPLQYVVGSQMFMGMPLKVSRSVLIPRPETEVLVSKVLEIIKSRVWDDPEILDLCAGSGAIGVSIAANVPHANVIMTDISAAALSVASENAEINSVDKRCRLMLGNLWEAVPEGKTFNVIVSNPPYIRSDVIDTLATEVKDYEPRRALDGGADGLNFYRRIAEKAADYLNPGGVLALEIGADQAAAVKALLEDRRAFASVSIYQDLAGLDRVVIAQKNRKEE